MQSQCVNFEMDMSKMKSSFKSFRVNHQLVCEAGFTPIGVLVVRGWGELEIENLKSEGGKKPKS
jgi:hypothetical protein